MTVIVLLTNTAGGLPKSTRVLEPRDSRSWLAAARRIGRTSGVWSVTVGRRRLEDLAGRDWRRP